MTILNRSIDIIGVPLDLGANTRGAVMGPAALRIAGLQDKIKGLGYEVTDHGDLVVPIRESLGIHASKEHFLHAITTVCTNLEDQVYAALKNRNIPVIIGGDHSIAIGSISGASRYFTERNEQLGLLWIDAHADMNTPDSSPSGNIHGMPLATVLGKGHKVLTQVGSDAPKVRPENVALIGIRDIDDCEKLELKNAGIRYFTMREIDERGKFAVMKEALDIVSSGTSGIHVSCDLDGVDPLFAPGVSTPVPGGLSYREIHLALEMLADSKKLCSFDLVELNPFFDREHQTANLGVGLILSALGKSIV